MIDKIKTVHKPWGKEEWLELNDAYCYKRIYINEGYKTSYQYHNFKKETNYIIEGTAEIWLENDEGVVEKKIMKAGEFFNVTPPKKHRVIAITDIILQEVSTPEVDDVIRINDEFNRTDGKINSEHQTPAVLVLAAGTGSRLGGLTKNVNKAMLPINNKAIISYIIGKFPSEYEFIVALGYKGKSLKEYCQLTYPNHKFTFVDIDNIDKEGSGPGYSALKCKEYLQRPFYFVVADCIIDSKMPHLDGNWLGVYPTSYPEKYSTIKTDSKDNILEFKNKSEDGFDNAFIGLASIWDFDIFWKELENNIQNGEIVSAFLNPSSYPSFKTKSFKWLDTGNLDDLNRTKLYFNDNPLSLYKVTDEITYKEGKFIKFNPSVDFIKNKAERANKLSSLIPSNFYSTDYFISYEWEKGNTLYSLDSLKYYSKFLEFFDNILRSSNGCNLNEETYKKFYIDKTENRKAKFIDRFGEKYYNQSFTINGKSYEPLQNILPKFLEISDFSSNTIYEKFHGDLQFDNIIFDPETEKFTYIDWRESFGGETKGGDVYYDLAKLYGGCIIPYNLAKSESFVNLSEGETIINYTYHLPSNLKKFKEEYESWIIGRGFNLEKIKIMTALIFLNMSPLHDDNFGKMLWFKSIEMLTNVSK
jgi:NDP-sugar pyrophosphorylase family protein/mannose-6-phosphate isomerase-like protein (cupin superfamily)